ncbi:hypothetical protein F4801DRAFT_583680 [Xylaria longipes]|nr:hypothetical protein F4801DRAFT_583680 [Xylaria longipes]RYC58989.1 hypothetical protein CHU98_g7238 [Xylaria longipes]
MGREASFLGIPREIRQYIYNYVIRFELNYEVVKLYKDGWCNGGFSTVMCRHPVEALTVPWVNLLLTCKSVNAELGAYMSSNLTLNNEDLRTYTMDIHGSSNGSLRSSTWQKIPCSPSNVNTALVNIHIKYNPQDWCVRTWGCGGPLPILRQLYQTLNLLLHNGPILSRASPLQHPLKFKNLDVNFTVTSDGIPGALPRETSIKCHLVTLKGVGLLRGYVDYVRINDENGHTELAIDAVDNAGVPTSWDGYGFEWGHNHGDSVKWEPFDEKIWAASGE